MPASTDCAGAGGGVYDGTCVMGGGVYEGTCATGGGVHEGIADAAYVVCAGTP